MGMENLVSPGNHSITSELNNEPSPALQPSRPSGPRRTRPQVQLIIFSLLRWVREASHLAAQERQAVSNTQRIISKPDGIAFWGFFPQRA